MFQDQVIRVWVIVYDQDSDRIYTFSDWQRVLQSVEGSIRSYMDGDHRVDEVISHIITNLSDKDTRAFIPLRINNLTIAIYGWELDISNGVHQLLSKCYDQVDDTLKLEIMNLFSNAR